MNVVVGGMLFCIRFFDIAHFMRMRYVHEFLLESLDKYASRCLLRGASTRFFFRGTFP